MRTAAGRASAAPVLGPPVDAAPEDRGRPRAAARRFGATICRAVRRVVDMAVLPRCTDIQDAWPRLAGRIVLAYHEGRDAAPRRATLLPDERSGVREVGPDGALLIA